MSRNKAYKQRSKTARFKSIKASSNKVPFHALVSDIKIGTSETTVNTIGLFKKYSN